MSRGELIVPLSNISTVKAFTHAHNFVCSATKSGPDSRSSAPVRGQSASQLAQLVCSSFFLPNYPIQELLQPTVPLRQKTTTITEDSQSKKY
jgi:hypothetical protein